jgi:hypothetical protein
MYWVNSELMTKKYRDDLNKQSPQTPAQEKGKSPISPVQKQP